MNSTPAYKTKLFYRLKSHNLVQRVLINTLLSKYNYTIENLAFILHADETELHKAWKGKGVLSDKDASNLVCLFYEF